MQHILNKHGGSHMETRTYLQSFHTYLYTNLIAILTDLTDEQIAYSAPQIDTRNIRDVAIHAYRPVLAVACLIAGREWPNRPQLPENVEDLLILLQAMHTQITNLLTVDITSKMLERTISLPWNKEQDAAAALIESIGHGLLHIGNIQGIRAIGGFPTPAEEAKSPVGNLQGK
jgi:hypothetical protein